MSAPRTIVSNPLAIRSRQPFVVTDDEGSSDNSSVDDASNSNEKEDQGYKAKEILIGFSGVKAGQLEFHRAKFKTDDRWRDVQKQLLREFNKHSSKRGSYVSSHETKRIKKQINNHKNEIFDAVIDQVFQPIQNNAQKRTGKSETSPQA
ncbi:hypothetical protein F4824DRAFT_495809 [Ustulina deusta]|nr:hypothetical protein F4824DRAFT_495809 [Ustulina deusta]